MAVWEDAPDSRQLSGADGGALRETRSSDDTRPPCAVDSRQFRTRGIYQTEPRAGYPSARPSLYRLPRRLAHKLGSLGRSARSRADGRDALDRDKQLAAVRRLADVVAESAGDTGLADRTWVILTDTYDGGWGIAGHANTNEEIVALARRTSQ